MGVGHIGLGVYASVSYLAKVLNKTCTSTLLTRHSTDTAGLAFNSGVKARACDKTINCQTTNCLSHDLSLASVNGLTIGRDSSLAVVRLD
jgi:hypothetical protein